MRTDLGPCGARVRRVALRFIPWRTRHAWLGRSSQHAPTTPAMSALLAEYNLYKRLEPLRVDCLELRPLEDHLWHLAEVCADLELSKEGDEQDGGVLRSEWCRVSEWLRAAAGLQYVDIDRDYGGPGVGFCETADEYYEAASHTASAFATEQTRLLYAWNASERLLRVLRPPPVQEAKGPYNAATQLLRSAWDHRPLPEHYRCVVAHLHRHIANERRFARELDLLKAFDLRPWRSESGVLLAAANQLRHLPAHGAVDVPEPDTWGHEQPALSRRTELLLHPPRLGTRGLALSVQMLIIAADPEAQLGGSRTPLEGWAVRSKDTWVQQEDPDWRCLVEQAHLEPRNFENGSP